VSERQIAESIRLDMVKIAGHVRISRELAEDLRLMREAMSRPISREDWEAWLAEPDPDWGDLIDGAVSA
jgi:hypothetical protein